MNNPLLGITSFKKINDKAYEAKFDAPVYDVIDNLISSFTNNKIEVFSPAINNIFTDHLLQRLVMDVFITKFGKDFKEVKITLDIGRDNKPIIFSGMLEDSVSGIVYNLI